MLVWKQTKVSCPFLKFLILFFFFNTNESSCGILFYTGEKKWPVLRWKFLSSLLETLLATVEREFPPNGVMSQDVSIMSSILRSAVSSCPLVEEVTDVYRWSTALAFVNFNSPSKRCAFFAISLIRIHIWGNYSLLYLWDLASWSLSCWRHCVCL